MNSVLLRLIFIGFLLTAPRVFGAERDSEDEALTPTPSIQFDHSYDNTDVDGTPLKPKANAASNQANPQPDKSPAPEIGAPDTSGL